MLKSTILFRIAAVLFLLFAAGHTYGFLSLVPPTPEALAVRNSMDTVAFAIHGKSFSYGGFYVGFGLFISVPTSSLPSSAGDSAPWRKKQRRIPAFSAVS